MPVEKTKKYIRVRQTNPDKYSKCRTIVFSKEDGIKAVVCKKGAKEPMEVQSILFDRDGWSKSEIKDWVKKHEQFSMP